MLNRTQPVGGLLREWRRRLSQLDLACDAGISTRHLSFVETGRALKPGHALLPNPIDQNLWAHWRNPMDMIFQG